MEDSHTGYMEMELHFKQYWFTHYAEFSHGTEAYYKYIEHATEV